MPNTSESVVEVVQSPDSTVIDRAMSARIAYQEAVESDGVTESAWRAIGEALAASAVELAHAGQPRYGSVEVCRSRAVDAFQRADYAARMVTVARQHRVIDMSSLGAAS